jgi:cytochrome P450
VVQTLEWFFRPIPFIERCRERYGSIFTLGLGPSRNTVVVAEPSLAREVVRGDPNVFRAGDANGLLRPVVGHDSLLVLDGEKHLRHRRILLPAFGGPHARSFAGRVEDIAAERVRGWREGERLELQAEMEAISFEAIMQVALGDEDPDRLDRLRQLIPEMMQRCASPFTILPYFRRELGGITPYARLRRVLDELDLLFFDAIKERRPSPDPKAGDVLSLMAWATDEAAEPLPEREIRDELLTMIMAGYETTTSALAWLFERLLRSPAVLQELMNRLDDDAYVDAVIKESLRLRPVVPVVARKLADEVVLGDHHIPAGAVLMVSVYLLHRDPSIYEDPDEFRPGRFLEDADDGPIWVPFGGGVRRCLGASFAQLELKVVLREVLRTVELSPVGQRAEKVARRRFTFAPARGARAVVSRKLAV